MRRPQRYTSFAPAYDVLSGERPVYRTGRVNGIGALRLRPGALVLDIGCGTGLNFPLIREAIGPAGRIVGVDASANMLDQARAKAERRGWMNIDLENADATTLTPEWLNDHLGPLRGPEGADAVLFTYSRGSDITAHPWTALERDSTDVQARSLRGGHIHVRAGTLRSP